MASSRLPSIRYASTLLITGALAASSWTLAADTSRRSADVGDSQKPAPAAPEEYFPTDNQIPLGKDGKPLSSDMVALGEKVRKTLATYEPKHLNARDNTCWEVMHGLIAFGPRTEIFRDGPGGQTVNAMGWLCWGGRCEGQPLIVLENNRPHALYGVGLEGHGGQFLAMLAQWKVVPASPMRIGGKDLTVADYIEEEKATCQAGTELTFKLIAMSHYLPSDAKWTSKFGEEWDIPRLLKAEIEAPITSAACGGSHRLFAISNAVKERAKRGEPIDGQWARAAKYIDDYQRYTLGRLQNPDGSFSTEWFKYPADRQGDVARKLQTTGHMLEWLVWSLPEDQLRDPRVVKAVNFLSDTLMSNPDKAWSIGPLGHALHALMIYNDRVYTEPSLPVVPLTAGQPLKTLARPVASTKNPPEPECDGGMRSGGTGSYEPTGSSGELEFPRQVDKNGKQIGPTEAERSDGCVESIHTKQEDIADRRSEAPLPPESIVK
jgi:hypothetical protein